MTTQSVALVAHDRIEELVPVCQLRRGEVWLCIHVRDVLHGAWFLRIILLAEYSNRVDDSHRALRKPNEKLAFGVRNRCG